MQNNTKLTQKFQKVNSQGRSSPIILHNAIKLLRFNLTTNRQSESFKMALNFDYPKRNLFLKSPSSSFIIFLRLANETNNKETLLKMHFNLKLLPCEYRIRVDCFFF